jgi:hypothetical protein
MIRVIRVIRGLIPEKESAERILTSRRQLSHLLLNHSEENYVYGQCFPFFLLLSCFLCFKLISHGWGAPWRGANYVLITSFIAGGVSFVNQGKPLIFQENFP